MKKIKLIFSLMFALAITLSLFIACQPDDNTGVGNGILGPVLDPSFTVTPVTGKTNTYTLKATATNYIGSKWDMGTGAGTADGKSEEKLFLPDAGTYTVTHTAVGIGGQQYSASKDIVVATSDPIAGNLVQGGKFANAADWAKWTIYYSTLGDPLQWKFNVGSASITPAGYNYTEQGIYQAIDVVADKKYNLDMIVSSPTGLVNCWFEVYVLPDVPVNGVHPYGNLGTQGVRAIHTWTNCGVVPFNGLISIVGCAAPLKGVITFPTSGKVYLMIRCGTENTTPTITVKNVEIRAMS
jgi:hypothetical protein